MSEISLNELMSDEPVAGSEGANIETTTTEPTQQARDEAGRFAAKQEAPAATAEPTPDQSQLDATDAAPKQPNGVPVRAVQEERQKRQEAEASVEAYRREIAELRGMIQAQRQPPQPQQQEQQPASLWDDPDAYLKSQLTPVQQQMREMREMMWEGQAAQNHGMEALDAAKQAAASLVGTPQGAQLHQQIMSGGNPFDNLVKWHKQQSTLQRIGNDPDAWLNAEMERRLNDPAEQAKILERIRGQASQNVNRSQPATNLPPSLSRMPAGGNQPADNDMSDGALFAHAMR